MTQALEVKLPVCPVPGCGNVARYNPHVAGIGGKMKFACDGGKHPHKATKMQMRTFREVVGEESRGAAES